MHMGGGILEAPVRHEPAFGFGMARHYRRELVYDASDGIITTFDVISGIAGASLQPRNGLATLLPFVIAGAVPLLPHAFSLGDHHPFAIGIGVTLLTLFSVRLLRAPITKLHWLRAGMEKLIIGGFAAAVPHGVGSLIPSLV